MYIIELTYLKPLSEVDHHLEAHKAFLNKYFESGNFIVSGRKNPRTGGIILCNAANKKELMNMVVEDPFYKYGLAEYKVIEFLPTMAQNAFNTYM